MEKIKIMHSADLHGDLDALKIYASQIKEKQPDISTVTGDLINQVFTEEEELIDYMKDDEHYQEIKGVLLQTVGEEFKKLNPEDQNKLTGMFPYELFHAIEDDNLPEGSIIEIPGQIQEGPSTKQLYELAKNPTISLSIGSATEKYLKLREHREKYLKSAEANMKSQYQQIAEIIKDTSCLILPGNYDGKCLKEIMNGRSLHKEGRKINDVNIAGYGSANAYPNWIPKELIERFQMDPVKTEGGSNYKLSQAGRLMIQADPDIAVLHEMPLMDEGLQLYIVREKPYLILGGHIHEMIGINRQAQNTYVIMPGKLGKTAVQGKHLEELKTFVEIDLNKAKEEDQLLLTLDKIVYHQIKEDKIQPFMEYKFDENGELKTKKHLSEDCILVDGWL